MTAKPAGNRIHPPAEQPPPPLPQGKRDEQPPRMPEPSAPRPPTDQEAESLNWWLTAKRASSSRLETPSLSKILLMWCLTVCSLIEHRCAMSGLEYPATTRGTISSSRGVRPNPFAGAAPPGGKDTLRNALIRSETLSLPTQYWPAITQRMPSNSRRVVHSFRITP